MRKRNWMVASMAVTLAAASLCVSAKEATKDKTESATEIETESEADTEEKKTEQAAKDETKTAEEETEAETEADTEKIDAYYIIDLPKVEVETVEETTAAETTVKKSKDEPDDVFFLNLADKDNTGEYEVKSSVFANEPILAQLLAQSEEFENFKGFDAVGIYEIISKAAAKRDWYSLNLTFDQDVNLYHYSYDSDVFMRTPGKNLVGENRDAREASSTNHWAVIYFKAAEQE